MVDTLELIYGATLSHDVDGIVVTFRDLDNVFSWGETEEEAIFNAREALDGVLNAMAAHDQEVTLPSKMQTGEIGIAVSPEVAAPVMLHTLRMQQQKSLVQVANTLGKSYQAYQRMEKTGSNLTLKSLKLAAAALGATVEIRFKTS
ncbi:type II toxin-antitoxin system HicB family antitoxin [uncultured Lamprocystis sp.]|jgi:antitoxin HicB|uniref:type II toxin-antitoxin system HicB family antitoxin n=1 Tax=uncultured Lamprocystis sp. TaxID=543132 RepID=UPI0025EEF381|nr:type II toxin-antitoxin system HicB family antitoxin [uncultured Lamprocystis sp.]